MRPAVILLVAANCLQAATFTSSQAGNWTSGSTWSGAGVPGAGDTWTINHKVTVQPGDSIVTGNSTPGMISGTINPTTGELVINGTFHLDGDLSHQGTITLGPDSVLEFGNAGYTWHSDTSYGVVNNMLQTSGTSLAHPFTIRTVAGGTNAVVTINGRASNKGILSYGTFLRMGTAAGKAYIFGFGGSTGAYLFVVTLDHVTFDGGGQLDAGTPSVGAGFSLSNVVFKNSLATNPLRLNATGAATVPRVVDQSVFDKPPLLIGMGAKYTRNVFMTGIALTSSTVEWAQFGEANPGDGMGNLLRVTQTSGSAPNMGNMIGNYILVDSPNAPTVTGSVTSATNSSNTGTLMDTGASWPVSSGAGTGYSADSSNKAWMVAITGGTGAGQIRSILSNTSTILTVLYPWATLPDSTSTYAILKGLGNPHVINCNGTLASTVNLSYNVAEHTGADNNGDLWSQLTGANSTYVINYNLALPSGSRDNPFDLFSPDSSAKPFSAEHNTVWAGGQSLGTLSDGANVPTGKMSSYRSNLVVSDPAWTNVYGGTGSGSWQASALGPYHLVDGSHANNPGAGTQDIVSPANVAYNGRWGLKAGAAGNGYHINESGTPDAAGAVSADPQFVDSTRNLGRWAYVRGYSASASPLQRVTDGLAALQADPTRIANLISYVRAGFAPRNGAYHNTAHDGTDIGAIPWTPKIYPRHRVAQ
jgi:hypothetical protein